MINIPVDESVAFDMLSILTVKDRVAKGTNEKIVKEMEGMVGAIGRQIGWERAKEIIHSDENIALLQENQYIFTTIDRLREGHKNISAEMIDNANLARYNAKQALQKKFFGTEMMEVKFTK